MDEMFIFKFMLGVCFWCFLAGGLLVLLASDFKYYKDLTLIGKVIFLPIHLLARITKFFLRVAIKEKN